MAAMAKAKMHPAAVMAAYLAAWLQLSAVAYPAAYGALWLFKRNITLALKISKKQQQRQRSYHRACGMVSVSASDGSGAVATTTL
jgi:hypothetical protein